MSEQSAPETEPPQPPAAAPAPRRAALGIGALLLTAASVLHCRHTVAERRPAERFAREFGFDIRRPLEAETIRIAPSGDLAADIVADAALRDAEDEPLPESLDSRLTRAWAAARSRKAEELSSARRLLLEALASRPGSATHRFLLGRVAFVEGRIAGASADTARLERWRRPLRAAAAAGPGVDAVWGALSRAHLETWPLLPPAVQGEARDIFRRAFFDSGVVSRDFLAVREAIGPEADLLLPADAAALSAAVDSLDGRAGVPATLALLKRLDRANRADRAARLREIERLHRQGETERLLDACESFAAQNPAGLFDDPAGRREVARVLELWPGGHAGSWPDDRRAEIVRFFLAGREPDVRPAALERALETLSGVPDSVRAEVQVLNGETGEAEELAAAAGGAGESEWISYFVRLARAYISRGQAGEAAEALARLAPAAREECDGVLARRDVARALGDADDARLLDQRLADLRAAAESKKDWSSGENLSLCVTPEDIRNGVLAVEVEADNAAIVAYGWDGGRSGIVALSRVNRLNVPLPRAPGRRTFTIETAVGGPVRLGEARLTGEGATRAVPMARKGHS
jgi:hypothetical protein